MIPKLGINIDHVATVRQTRGEDYPDLIRAVRICCENGADQITIHLREDRRHIQDKDVFTVRQETKKSGHLFNLEMGCSREIAEIAVLARPDWVCLVPENRQEMTTEGGLDLQNEESFKRVEKTCGYLKKSMGDLRISLFLEPDLANLEYVFKLEGLVDAVEIHTGHYAKAFSGGDIRQQVQGFVQASEFLGEKNISVHAGHGLTKENVVPLLKNSLFCEYNIGHWVVCESVFSGLANVVAILKKMFSKREVVS